MNKPYSMVINELRRKIVDDINNSGLHISVVEMILQQILEQVSLTAKNVAEEEKKSFDESIEIDTKDKEKK